MVNNHYKSTRKGERVRLREGRLSVAVFGIFVKKIHIRSRSENNSYWRGDGVLGRFEWQRIRDKIWCYLLMIRANKMRNEEAPVITFVVDGDIFEGTPTLVIVVVTRDGDVEHEGYRLVIFHAEAKRKWRWQGC